MNNELYHYGVPGMKWGHRKAPTITVNQRSTNRKVASAQQAKQRMKAAKKAYKSANKAFDKAYRNSNSWLLNSQFDKADNKRRNEAALQAAQKAERAHNAYKKAKANYKMSNKQAKTAVKNVKKEYAKQILAGESTASRLFDKFTGAHKYAADMLYEANRNKK